MACLYQLPTDVDFRVMLTFVEFYATLMGFVNFKLYHSLNLKYPPQVLESHMMITWHRMINWMTALHSYIPYVYSIYNMEHIGDCPELETVMLHAFTAALCCIAELLWRVVLHRYKIWTQLCGQICTTKWHLISIWNCHICFQMSQKPFWLLLQIEGLSPPPTADSIPSQVPDADTLFSAEEEDHREVGGTHVVTWPTPPPLLIGCFPAPIRSVHGGNSNWYSFKYGVAYSVGCQPPRSSTHTSFLPQC